MTLKPGLIERQIEKELEVIPSLTTNSKQSFREETKHCLERIGYTPLLLLSFLKYLSFVMLRYSETSSVLLHGFFGSDLRMTKGKPKMTTSNVLRNHKPQ